MTVRLRKEATAPVAPEAPRPSTGSSAAERLVGTEVSVFTLRQSGGGYFGLGSFCGAAATDKKRAIVLQFYASTSEPTQAGLKSLVAMERDLSDPRLLLVLVSIDRDTNGLEQTTSLAGSQGVSFPIVSDRFNIVAKRYLIDRIPTTFVLDGDCRAASVVTGSSAGGQRTTEAAVRRLLGR